MSGPHEALMALARDLVEEISAGRAIELAAAGGHSLTVDPTARTPEPPPEGAQAVHPELGGHLLALPGDTISGHAYKHLGLAPPIAGQ